NAALKLTAQSAAVAAHWTGLAEWLYILLLRHARSTHHDVGSPNRRRLPPRALHLFLRRFGANARAGAPHDSHDGGPRQPDDQARGRSGASTGDPSRRSASD